MRLNIGCGEFYAPGWTNTDLHDDEPGGPRPDVTGSILSLPFADGVAERVYCGHVLEHVALEHLPRALGEVRRVLAPDGQLMVVGPDVTRTALYEPALMDGVVHGGRRWPGDEHKYPATGEMTLAFVRAAGFAARLIPVETVPDEWPIVARVLWQFAIEAKPNFKE